MLSFDSYILLSFKNTSIYYGISKHFDDRYCDAIPDELHPTCTGWRQKKICGKSLNTTRFLF